MEYVRKLTCIGNSEAGLCGWTQRSECFSKLFTARMPVVKSCLFCCSLRTGAMIIAAASTMLFGVYCISLLALMFCFVKESVIIIDTIPFDKPKFMFVHVAILFTFCAMLEIFSVFLMIGIKQYKETYVLAWAVATTAVNIFQTFVLLCYFFTMQRPIDYPTDFFPVLDVLLCFYVAVVIFSYYREIVRMKDRPRMLVNEQA